MVYIVLYIRKAFMLTTRPSTQDASLSLSRRRAKLQRRHGSPTVSNSNRNAMPYNFFARSSVEKHQPDTIACLTNEIELRAALDAPTFRSCLRLGTGRPFHGAARRLLQRLSKACPCSRWSFPARRPSLCFGLRLWLWQEGPQAFRYFRSLLKNHLLICSLKGQGFQLHRRVPPLSIRPEEAATRDRAASVHPLNWPTTL